MGYRGLAAMVEAGWVMWVRANRRVAQAEGDGNCPPCFGFERHWVTGLRGLAENTPALLNRAARLPGLERLTQSPRRNPPNNPRKSRPVLSFLLSRLVGLERVNTYMYRREDTRKGKIEGETYIERTDIRAPAIPNLLTQSRITPVQATCCAGLRPAEGITR